MSFSIPLDPKKKNKGENLLIHIKLVVASVSGFCKKGKSPEKKAISREEAGSTRPPHTCSWLITAPNTSMPSPSKLFSKIELFIFPWFGGLQ